MSRTVKALDEWGTTIASVAMAINSTYRKVRTAFLEIDPFYGTPKHKNFHGRMVKAFFEKNEIPFVTTQYLLRKVPAIIFTESDQVEDHTIYYTGKSIHDPIGYFNKRYPIIYLSLASYAIIPILSEEAVKAEMFLKTNDWDLPDHFHHIETWN